MKVKHIIKSIVLASVVGLCILGGGCSRAYIERTDAWIKNCREREIRPSRLKFYSNESRRPRPLFFGAPNISPGHIHIDPGSISIPAH